MNITITLTDTQYKGLQYAALDIQSLIDEAYNEELESQSCQYGNYTILKTGVVISNATGRRLSEFNKTGYPAVTLREGDASKTKKVHRLLAECFLDKPEGSEVVNHLDGNKENYSLDNLEWTTQSENMKHAWATGLKKTTDQMRENCKAIAKIRGKQSRKLTYEDAEDIRTKYKTGSYRYKDLADEYSVSISSISKIINNIYYLEA
jgi:hypothetical protein